MRFLIMALTASVAFGQTNRTFQLTQNENKQDLAEISRCSAQRRISGSSPKMT